MSLRRRSCRACFAAKRRCDLGYPSCRRCMDRRLTCRYAYPPCPPVASTRTSASREEPSGPQALTHNGESDLTTPGNNDNAYDQIGDVWNQSQALILLPHSFSSDLGNPSSSPNDDWPPPAEALYPTRTNEAPAIRFPTELKLNNRHHDRKTGAYCVREFRSYLNLFVRDGSTPFIHRRLYSEPEGRMPKPLRTAYGICAAYCSRTEANEDIFMQVLEAEVDEILEAPLYSPLDELARVQSLILYQIIGLFDGDVRLRFLAEQHMSALEGWTLQLQNSTSSAADVQSQSLWRKWLLAESVRRTVTTSYILRAVYSVLKYQHCSLIPTLEVLPVSTYPMFGWCLSGPLTAPQQKSNSALDSLDDLNPVVSYLQFTEMWSHGLISDVEAFGTLLLVACKGEDAVKAISYPTIADEQHPQ